MASLGGWYTFHSRFWYTLAFPSTPENLLPPGGKKKKRKKHHLVLAFDNPLLPESGFDMVRESKPAILNQFAIYECIVLANIRRDILIQRANGHYPTPEFH
jgi:hypothetical protein